MNLETYCPIPYSEMFIRNDGRVLICCDTNQIVGNIHENSLQEIFEQSFLVNLRKTFKNGERHPICKKCWDREENVGGSFRHNWIQDFNIRYISKDHYQTLEEFAENASTRIRKLKIDFSNACNMKCPMCSISRSTGWLKDWEKFNGMYSNNPDSDLEYLSKPINEQATYETTAQLPISFIDDNWEIIRNANLIDLSGGEPFYMPQVKYLLDRLEDEQWDGYLKIITNASLIEPFIEQLRKFKCRLVISCDAYGAELYPVARPVNGKQISWKEFVHVMQELKNANINHSHSYVPQLMNIHNIESWLDWCNNFYGNTVATTIALPLVRPDHLQISNYPDEDFKKNLSLRLGERSIAWPDMHSMRALIASLKIKHNPASYNNFLSYMEKLDSIRNTNFMDYWKSKTHRL